MAMIHVIHIAIYGELVFICTTNIIMLASPNPQILEVHLRIWLQHSVLSTLTVRYDTYTWNCALIRKYTILHFIMVVNTIL